MRSRIGSALRYYCLLIPILFSCPTMAAENVSGVPDPYGLGERLAIIDALNATMSNILRGQELPKLRLVYASLMTHSEPSFSKEELDAVSQTPSGVPDPDKLGERGALIFFCQGKMVEYDLKKDIEILRDDYAVATQVHPTHSEPTAEDRKRARDEQLKAREERKKAQDDQWWEEYRKKKALKELDR